MTREEAVWYVNHTFEIIKEELCNSGRFDEAKEFEIAQNMAIEALQFQDIMINNPKSAKPTPEVCKTCMDNEQIEAVTDCISRERAIEVVKRAKTKEIAYSALINLEPKEIPTCDECRLPKCLADKQDDWIPVSERLPEKNGDYIVSLEDAVDTSASFFNGKWFMSSFDCI